MNSAKAGKVILLQLALTLAVAVLAGVFSGWVAAISAMVGGAIAVVGAVVYVKVAYAVPLASPQVLMRAHFRAEMFKLLVTAILFALVFMGLKGVAALWVFLAFAAASAAYWLVLVSIKNNG